MKTKTKVVTSIIAIMLSCVLLFATIIIMTNNNSAVEALQASTRTVDLTYNFLDDQSISNDFDEFDYQTDANGFEIIAKKNFDASILSELDLVGINQVDEDFTVRYDVQYIEGEEAVLLSVTIESDDEISIIDTIPGLVTYNSQGDPDVMFVVEDEIIWLSDLQDLELVDEVGWFSSLLKKITKVVTQAVTTVASTVVKAVAPIIKYATKLTTKVAVSLLGSKNAAAVGAYVLMMAKDEQNETVYHATFDCWQQYFGYTDFYDTVFDAATSMRNAKFPFDIDGDNVDDYILWAWKGDYLTLGAGAELGIYKRWGYSDVVWIVDKSLAMTMSINLIYKKDGSTIFDWRPTKKQWWITGFNYKYDNKDRDDLTATYSVTFNMDNNNGYSANNLYNAFIKRWGTAGWTKTGNLSASFEFKT